MGEDERSPAGTDADPTLARPDAEGPAGGPAGLASAPAPEAGAIEVIVQELRQRDQERKQQLDTVLSWIATQVGGRTVPVGQASSQAEPTDDELWGLAQQGDRQAFETYQRRVARQEVLKGDSQRRREAVITSQLTILTQKYPVLRDPSHPLTQTVRQAYDLLLQAGYPAGWETLLDASKTAIADRPDLVAALHAETSVGREHARQSATDRAQSGVMGATTRSGSAPPEGPRVSRDEAQLAARMGVKDPKGAKERFLKRQESGQSNLGAVGGFPAVIKELESF